MNDDVLTKMIYKAAEELAALDNLFDQKGYVVLAVDEVAAFVPKLKSSCRYAR